MATISLKAYETAVAVLSGASELNSLAHGSLGAVTATGSGVVLDNTVAGTEDLYADFELNVGTLGGNALVGGRLILLMWASLDGTNYPQSYAAGTFDPNLIDPEHIVGTFTVPAGMTTTGKLHIYRKPMLAGKMKFQLLNLCGQALPASGASVNCYRYNLASA